MGGNTFQAIIYPLLAENFLPLIHWLRQQQFLENIWDHKSMFEGISRKMLSLDSYMDRAIKTLVIHMSEDYLYF